MHLAALAQKQSAAQHRLESLGDGGSQRVLVRCGLTLEWLSGGGRWVRERDGEGGREGPSCVWVAAVGIGAGEIDGCAGGLEAAGSWELGGRNGGREAGRWVGGY